MQRRRKILPTVRRKSKSVMPDTEVTDMKKQADSDMVKQLLQMCSLHSGCRGDHNHDDVENGPYKQDSKGLLEKNTMSKMKDKWVASRAD